MPRGNVVPSRSSGVGVNPFLLLQREMKRMFDDLRLDFGASLLGEASEGAFLMPRLEVREGDKDMRVIAELPGVSEKDIDVSLDDDVLTIRAEKQSEHTGEKEDTHFSERAFGTFQRSMRLPYRVEPSELKATFADGVLTGTIPKNPAQEKARKIPVQSQAQSKDRGQHEATQKP